MTRPLWLWMLLTAGLVSAGCTSDDGHHAGRDHDGSSAAAHHDDGDDDTGAMDEADDGDEQEIALSAVPANVLAAARAALPGAKFTEAETETENGVVTYTLEGVKDGVEWEVEVGADGRVIEVEKDDD